MCQKLSLGAYISITLGRGIIGMQYFFKGKKEKDLSTHKAAQNDTEPKE